MEKTKIKLSSISKNTEFEVSEGQNLIISDPCYDLNDINSDREINYKIKAKSGTWVYDLDIETMTIDIYELYSSFLVCKEGMKSSLFDKILYFGVDSGQVGVFLESSYQNDSLVENIEFENGRFKDMKELWYRACCEVTTTGTHAGFVPNGFVTGTKHGDGVYPVGIKYASGTDEVAYIRIITDYVCEYCGAIDDDCECRRCSYCNKKELECECEYCSHCYENEYECNCEFCDECEELLDECICDNEDDK